MKLFRFTSEEIGAEKCGSCNWETEVFYWLSDTRENALKEIESLKEDFEFDEPRALCGSCIADLLVDEGYEIKQPIITVEVTSDVIERMDGREKWQDEDGLYAYETKNLKQLLDDPEDDTNESTRVLLEELYDKVKDYTYFKLV